MERKGFVMISRDILDIDMWRNPYDGLLFFYCLMKASHNYFNVLKPGQLYFSVQSAAKKLQWSRNSVAKHLRALSDAGLITVKTTDLGSIITINSWNEICGEPANTHDGAAFVQNSHEMNTEMHEMYMAAQIMHIADQDMKSNARQMSTKRTRNEHYQKDTQKENQKDTNTYERREHDFLRWWAMYPRHDGRSEAKRIWMEDLRSVPAETLVQALEFAKRSDDWQKENGRYVPSAAKWLDGRWEDYLPKQRNEVQSTWMEY